MPRWRGAYIKSWKVHPWHVSGAVRGVDDKEMGRGCAAEGGAGGPDIKSWKVHPWHVSGALRGGGCEVNGKWVGSRGICWRGANIKSGKVPIWHVSAASEGTEDKE